MARLVCAVLVACLSAIAAIADSRLSTKVITADDTRITASCEVEIATGLVIQDKNHNGVILIDADNVTVRFKPGSVLRGAPLATPWDQLQGIGIRANGRRNFTLQNAQVHGFKNGVVASNANGLEVSGGDFSDNFRQRLKSTPAAEDGADWLFPHHNDETKWSDKYGGAVCVGSSQRVRIHNIRVRHGQNGIILDRVSNSSIYDNDCSFLSGWGLALWRSSENVVSRNAFDFCVRGHVEGVYNRGQDSAGILAFEQCNRNVFAENSATHGGDCFFGFAGREAIGEAWMEGERERLRKETGRKEVDDLIRPSESLVKQMSALGCNSNLFVGNDFSYAPAHGIEMTFSEGNMFVRNRLVENAICGVWGGYSSRTLISQNEFTGNGGKAYGLERGGINMEHAADNLIVRNRFRNNKCGIHLWWDDDGALLKFPGVAGNERGVSGNIIAGNEFQIDDQAPFKDLRESSKLIVLQLRDSTSNHATNNLYFDNKTNLTHPKAVEFDVKPGSEPIRHGKAPIPRIPSYKVLGKTAPVGARKHLRGREQIIMDQWGPWDHESPLLRPIKSSSNENAYEILGLKSPLESKVLSGDVATSVTAGKTAGAFQLRVRAQAGVTPFQVRVLSGNYENDITGVIVATEWKIKVFSWDIDPRKDLDGWRKLAQGPGALSATIAALDFPYGWGGPRDMKLSEEITRSGPAGDHFGSIATTRLKIPPGRWRFKTLSDDGVRVTVNGSPVIENWTWHGPTPNEDVYDHSTGGDVEIMVEHFEIDGYATLRLDIEPVSPLVPKRQLKP